MLSLTQLLELKGGISATKRLEDERRKYENTRTKQEQLLSVCLHMLLNLAEDVMIEKKMKKRNIVSYLVELLDWDNPELQLVILTFLKKLSIYKENKDEMVRNQFLNFFLFLDKAISNLVSKMVKFVPSEHEALLSTVLRLLLNLSFDVELQQQMVKSGFIPKLVELIPLDSYRPVVLKVLYHLSMTEKFRSLFNFTDAIPMVKY